MTRSKLLLMVVVSTGLLMVAALPSLALGETTLWYRGHFDGEVRVEGTGPTPGYHYYPSSGATIPLLEHYYSYPLPCDKCGYYHKRGEKCPETDEECDGSGSHVRRDHVYQPYRLLPGAYYYKRQPHYNFRTPINVGYPYVKYNQRW